MATKLRRKFSVFGRRIFIVVLAFQNGLEYWNGDGQLRSALNVSTSCTNLVRFGEVTLEKKTFAYFCTCVKKWHKLAYPAHYLRKFATYFNHIFSFGRHGCDPDLFFRFLKGRCHGKQFWAKFAKWPLFNMLALWNRFKYRNSDLQLLKGNIFATFCASLIAIGSLTPEDLCKVTSVVK